MRSPTNSMAGVVQRVAVEGNTEVVKRALTVAENKAALFSSSLVYWPALAASFQRDADLLRKRLEEVRGS